MKTNLQSPADMEQAAAIREQNPQAQFFCVGDDWQAINGFAGSDLRFYQNFSQIFQPSQKLNISTNYRSAKPIVDISNKFMQGLGTPARIHKNMFSKVEIADIGQFIPRYNEQNEHYGDIITPAILRLIDKPIKDGNAVGIEVRFYDDLNNILAKYYVDRGQVTLVSD